MNPVLEAIFARRSSGRLIDPAPSDEHLDLLLRAAAAAPDHGRLRPTRFVVLRGQAKEEFGEVLEQAYLIRCAAEGLTIDPAKADKERTKLGRAPLVVVVANVVPDPDHPKAARIPRSEQRDSTAAAVQNLLLAATSLGYGSMWRSGAVCQDRMVATALGLGEKDEAVAFVYLGTIPDGMQQPANDPDTSQLSRDWAPA